MSAKSRADQSPLATTTAIFDDILRNQIERPSCRTHRHGIHAPAEPSYIPCKSRPVQLRNSYTCPEPYYAHGNVSLQLPMYPCSRPPTMNQSSPRIVWSRSQPSHCQYTDQRTEAASIHTPQPYECSAASRITSFLSHGIHVMETNYREGRLRPPALITTP